MPKKSRITQQVTVDYLIKYKHKNSNNLRLLAKMIKICWMCLRIKITLQRIQQLELLELEV